MAAHTRQAVETGARLVFAPAQQLPALPDDALLAGLDAAWLVAGNDYELELIRARTGRGVGELRAKGAIVAVTLGGQGSVLHTPDGVEEIPVARVERVVDPTGAGDAYIAGLLAGLRRKRPASVAGRMGALAAAYAVERSGPQSHGFDAAEFGGRYRDAFGEALE
jgi:adenosine kinase